MILRIRVGCGCLGAWPPLIALAAALAAGCARLTVYVEPPPGWGSRQKLLTELERLGYAVAVTGASATLAASLVVAAVRDATKGRARSQADDAAAFLYVDRSQGCCQREHERQAAQLPARVVELGAQQPRIGRRVTDDSHGSEDACGTGAVYLPSVTNVPRPLLVPSVPSSFSTSIAERTVASETS